MMSTTHEALSPHISKPRGKCRGQIQIIFGPMFSGKTTELIRRMKRFMFAKSKCLLVKYSKDDRYDKDGVATHDRQVLPAVSATSLLTLSSQAFHCDVIGIDEGQFFPDVVEFCDKMAELGKTVIVAALDGTFQKVGFGDILNLVPLAESVVKLTAVCMRCYRDASFTKRIGQETEVEVIGGADKYLAVCRTCFLTPKKNEDENNENTPILSELSTNKKTIRKLFSTSNSPNIMSS